MRLRDAERESGFTLIELMVTLAVLAIVLAAAAPSFTDFFDKYRLRGAADGVVSLIGNARIESVKNDLDVNIAFGGTTGTGWCLGANAATPPSGGNPAVAAAACNCTVAAACRVSGQEALIPVNTYPDVKIAAFPLALTFDSKLGTVTPLGNRAVTLTSPSGKYNLQVDVNPLGQARICRPALSPVIAGVATC